MDGKTYIDPIRESEKRSITPDLPGDKSREKEAKADVAKSDLKSSESGAASNVNNIEDTVSSARNAENSPISSFANNVTGGKTASKGKFKGFFKKQGPLLAILGLIIGGGGALFGAQTMQPFALVNNIFTNYSSSSYSTTARLTNFIKKAVKGETKIKDSPELERSLNDAGVKMNTDADGNISLEYKVDGDTKIASSNNIDTEINGKLGNNLAKAGESIDVTSTYDSPAKTSAANRIDWNKSRYADFDNDTKTDGDVEFKEIAEGGSRVTGVSDPDQRYQLDETDDEDNPISVRKEIGDDGKPKYFRSDTGEEVDPGRVNASAGGDTKATNIDTKSAQTDTESVKLSLSDIAAKAATGLSTIECAYSAASTAIAAVTISQQIMNMINMSSGYMEAVQKVQAGDGNGNSFHQYQNNTNQINSEGKGFWTSTSIAGIFGGSIGNSSAGISNVESPITSNAAISIGSSASAWRTCLGMKIFSNAIDTVGDIVGMFTVGIGKGVQLAIKAATAAGVAVVAGLAINKLVEYGVKSIAVDVIADMGSEEAGDYTVSGGNVILSAMGRSTGLSAGTAEKIAEFNVYKNSVIARRAEYDQDNLSPFDISSPYTFAGKLLNSATSFAVLNSGNQFMKLFTSAGSILSNSVVSLLPASSAITYNSIINQEGDCPLINSAGATGTALHCNYNSISDTSTFGITYEEAVDYLCKDEKNLKNCHTDSAPEVVPNSELAKYIEFWTMRDSHLGLADSSITNKAHILELNSQNGTADAVVNGAIGSLPGAGLIDIANAVIDNGNEDYIFGSAYVAGGEFWNNHPEMKYIQTYLELDTLYSDLALIKSSTLANYLENYYKENPLDNSYEGRLARFSGLSKSDVIATLNLMKYYEYIADYDPSDRYAFGDEGIIPERIQLDSTTTVADNAIKSSISQEIIYYDLRSRTATMA